MGSRAGRARFLLCLAAIVASVAVAACGSSDESASKSGDSGSSSTASSNTKPLKVALVYNAPITDQGWNAAWAVATREVESKFGNKVAITYKENVPDGPQSGNVMKQLIQDGNQVIVSTSFGYQQAALKLAGEHPDVKFLQVTALKRAKNLTGFDFYGAEGEYVAGMAAAAASKSDRIGMVGAYPIPSNLAYINAFALGAQKMNPKAKVQVVWTNDWVSTTKAQNAAQGLVNSGAGALASLTSGPGTAPVAKSSNTPWIGFEVDQRDSAAQQYVTGVELHWAPYLEQQIAQIQDGTWKTGYFFGGMKEGVVKPDNWGDAFQSLSSDQKAKIEDAVKQLQAGSLQVFQGPIKDQSGKVRVPEGKALTPQETIATDYLVSNIEGSIPKAG